MNKMTKRTVITTPAMTPRTIQTVAPAEPVFTSSTVEQFTQQTYT